jgi:ubiquinone/menaquinone biosynthesis C-methylase UbiE
MPSPVSFDVVVCQFGLMFFSDREKAAREMLRVMVPGGRCAVAVWDAIEKAPAFAALVDLLDHVAGRPAGDALRAPFALGDRQMLAALFKDAGASSVDLTTYNGAARFPNMREFIEAELRGWLPVMGVVLPEP